MRWTMLVLLGGTLVAQDFEESEKAIEEFAKGEALVQKSRYREALPHYEAALEHEPGYHTCRYRYAQVALAIARAHTLDAEDFRAAAAGPGLDSAKAASFRQRGDSLRVEARPYYTRAEAALRTLEEVWPHNPGVPQSLALVHIDYDRLEEARACFSRALELTAEDRAADTLRRAIEAVDEELARRAAEDP